MDGRRVGRGWAEYVVATSDDPTGIGDAALELLIHGTVHACSIPRATTERRETTCVVGNGRPPTTAHGYACGVRTRRVAAGIRPRRPERRVPVAGVSLSRAACWAVREPDVDGGPGHIVVHWSSPERCARITGTVSRSDAPGHPSSGRRSVHNAVPTAASSGRPPSDGPGQPARRPTPMGRKA